MHKNDISSSHKQAKKVDYWTNLTQGNTGAYKEKVINKLLSNLEDFNPKNILDLGCGTADIAFRYKEHYHANNITLMDYDQSVLEKLKNQWGEANARYLCADIFAFPASENTKYDLIFLLDMVHEIYSFYGRPNKVLSEYIEHDLGISFVKKLIANTTQLTAPGGVIVITDNVLPEVNTKMRTKVSDTVVELVKRFFADYPSRKIEHTWIDHQTLEIHTHDFAILLTQYNKLKSPTLDRWNVEKMEIHQYFTEQEYHQIFSSAGFSVTTEVATPDDADLEWKQDFTPLPGFTIPQKRITVCARKTQ